MKKIKEQIKNKEKEKIYKIRFLREINNGLINISTVRKSTLEKYNINLMKKVINIFLNKSKHIYY
jgi:hypothetical protein